MNTQATPPMEAVTRKNIAIICTSALRSASGFLGGGLGGIERRGEALLLAVVARPVPEARTPDSGRAVAAEDIAVGILADHVVEEDVLGDDDVAFHPQHLGDVGDAARAVAQTRGLHHDVDRSAYHLADRARGQREAAH